MSAAFAEPASSVPSIAQQALLLWSTNHAARFRFPAWVADEWDGRLLPAFGPSAAIYHASGNLPEVRTMAVFREPTNIAMDRKGSPRTLDEFYRTALFGTDASTLARLFPEGKFSGDPERDAAIGAYYRREEASGRASPSSFRRNLEGAYRFTIRDYRMPQIAAYARTPMRYSLPSNHCSNGTSYSNEDGVHVLSVVGAGFDAWQQPDYQYYFDKITQDIRSDREREFYRERQVAFAMALQCAYDHQLDRIEFVPVGAGAFSALLPPGRVSEYLVKAWESEEVQSYKNKLEMRWGKEIVVSLRMNPPFSHNNGLGPGIPSFYEESGWIGGGHKNWKDSIDRTLFINAWDPWSLVGNGNEMDHSVDGMYGRQSALSLLCWPVANPHIQYKRIQF